MGQGFSFSNYYPPEEYGGHIQNWTAIKDTNGYIHFGNGSGLLTFNGAEWINIHIGETGRGLSYLTSRSGRVYVSGQSDFGYLEPDSISNISYTSISENFYESGEYVPPHLDTFQWNDAIFYRHAGGINKYQDEQLIRFSNEGDNFRKAFLAEDSLLIGSKNGIVSFNLKKENGFKALVGSNFLAGDNILFAFYKAEDEIVFGSRNNLLSVYNGTGFSSFKTEADSFLSENKIYDGIKINENLFAIATLNGGVAFIDSAGNLVKMLTEKNGLLTNQVYDLYLDDERILWLGLQKGIQKILLDDNFTVFGKAQGINDIVLSFAVSEDAIWVRTTFGMLRGSITHPENTWHFEEVEVPENFNSIFLLNEMFYGIGDSGVFLLKDENNIQKVIEKTGLIQVKTKYEPQFVTLLTQNELIKFDGEQIYTQTMTDLELVHGSEALMKGDSLFVMNIQDGVQLIVDDEIKTIPLDINPDAKTRYNNIGFINGEIFLAVEGGNHAGSLFKYIETTNRFSTDHFLAGVEEFKSQQTLNFQQCGDSEIWFVANLKLIRVFKEDDKWEVDNSSYRMIKGLNATEQVFDYNCQQNSIWFGGADGLIQLKNSEIEYNTEFKTNITRIFTNRDSLIYGGFGKPRQDIILPYINNELRFQYAAASYIDPKRNQYQVKLEGFDKDWSTWTSETQKDYTNIPEGEYTFRVRSNNAYDVAGVPAAISFQILPPWYRTWWAYLLYTISIAGILYTAYKIRVNQLLRVERIRNNIASDLHDEVSATLSSISYFAQAIQSDKLKKDKDRFVKLIANSAGDAKEKITDIVWAINPEHDDWQAFLSKCRRYASDLLESKNMKYSLKIDEHIPGKLDMQLRQHLWLIFKEMVTNAARHSDAKQLDVIMNYEEGLLKLVVQDDGKGMDIDKIKKGNGLVNIQKRADLIDGDISLKTSEGFGTRWILKVTI